MPITQERMLDLISAGRDFQSALHHSIQTIRGLSTEVREGLLAPEAALTRIEAIVSLQLLRTPIHSSTVLAKEEAHFKSHAKRNEYVRGLRRRQRGKAKPQEQGESQQGGSQS